MVISFVFSIADSNDYTGVSTVLTFSQSHLSEQSECVTITIIDDEIPESCETLSVDISTDSEPAIINESSRIITILDNEGYNDANDY